jgi:hypothetical protein
MANPRNTKELLQALEATNKKLQGLLDNKIASDKKEMPISKDSNLKDTDKEQK